MVPHLVKMKDIDMGKEYIIPSPGYRSVRERSGAPGPHRDPEESRFQRSRPVSSLSRIHSLPTCWTTPCPFFTYDTYFIILFFCIGFGSMLRIYDSLDLGCSSVVEGKLT